MLDLCRNLKGESKLNTATGAVYRDRLAIQEARKRDEPVAEVSEEVADAVEVGMVLNRAMRRALARGKEWRPTPLRRY